MIPKEVIEQYLPTIGIECHVQLKTATKLFSSEQNDARGAAPNTVVGHISFGMPGSLPVLNKAAVELSARTAFILIYQKAIRLPSLKNLLFSVAILI